MESQIILQTLAPAFGYNPSETADYLSCFRNPVLRHLTTEQILIAYRRGGIEAVAADIRRLRDTGVL